MPTKYVELLTYIGKNYSKVFLNDLKKYNIFYKYWIPDKIDDLIERYTESGIMPYWGYVWPSSIALIKFLLKNKDLFNKKDVLDLGCGVGVSSLPIATSCKNITLVDYQVEALFFAKLNFLENLIPLDNVQFINMDWNFFSLNKNFDLIIGADIIYEQSNFYGIKNILLNNLKKEGCLILTEPGRTVSINFLQNLSKYFKQVKIVKEKFVDKHINQTIIIHIFQSLL